MPSEESSRLVKNSMFLYIRMLFSVWLNLYTTRLILQNLGVEDMGIYNLVGGVVSMFSVLSSGLGLGSQRYITYEIGKKGGDVNKVFCNVINILLITSFIIVIFLETAGLWFLNNRVVIPEDRLFDAIIVFHISVFTCLISIVSIPYNSLIIAHERIKTFAQVSLIQVFMQCVIAYSLVCFNNRLITYAILIGLLSVVIAMVYLIYCRVNFKESRYRWQYDKELTKSMLGFTTINTADSIFIVVAMQGFNLIINSFFGAAINAVYAIAMQVKMSILSFSMNIQRAIDPQITKCYAEGNLVRVNKLIYTGSKIQSYLFLLVVIPFLAKQDYILTLWLKDVPQYTSLFVTFFLFSGLVLSIIEPTRTAANATGDIRGYYLFSDSFYLLNLPAGYIVLHFTGDVIYALASFLFFDIVRQVIRLFMLERILDFSIWSFIKRVLTPLISIFLICFGAVCFIDQFIADSIWGTILLICLSSLLIILTSYIIGLSREERAFIHQFVKLKRG